MIRNSGFRKFMALLAFYSTEFSNYRAEFVIYLLGGSQPIIMLFIWVTLNNSGQLSGDYTSTHFVCYFLLIYAVRNCNAMWFPWAMDEEIRQGDLSFKLLRPVNPYWNYLAYQLADNVIRIPLMLPVLIGGFYVTSAYTELSPTHLPLALLSLLFGISIHFYSNFLMGTVSFWLERTRALEMMYYSMLILLGGAIVPLELFPDGLRQIVMFTPFPYLLGFPVDVAMGRLGGAELVRGFAMQAVWVLLIGFAGRALWRAGTKGYSGAGA